MVCGLYFVDHLGEQHGPRRRGQRPLGPMGKGPVARTGWLTGQGNDLADLLGLKGRRGARARAITQPLGEALPLVGAPALAPAL